MSLKPFQSPQRRGVVCRTRSLGRAFQCHTASSVQRPQDSASITAWPACKTRMPIPGSNATCNSGACSCLATVVRPHAISPLFSTGASFRAALGRRSGRSGRPFLQRSLAPEFLESRTSGCRVMKRSTQLFPILVAMPDTSHMCCAYWRTRSFVGGRLFRFSNRIQWTIESSKAGDSFWSILWASRRDLAPFLRPWRVPTPIPYSSCA